MAKKLSKKELQKLEIQMGISKVQHDRPPVGRPTVFYGKTNKQKRREGKMAAKECWLLRTDKSGGFPKENRLDVSVRHRFSSSAPDGNDRVAGL